MSNRNDSPGPKGQATKQAILAAAAELFSARGASGVSITDIAAKAGVNRALIAYYFGSKSGLYDAIIESAVEDAAKTLASVSQGRKEGDPVKRLVLVFAEILSRRPHFVRMIIQGYFETGQLFRPGAANKLAGFIALTEEMLREAELTPRAKSYDPQIVHLIIVGALNYFILTSSFRRRVAGRVKRQVTNPSVDEFAEVLAEIVSRGLGR